MDVVPSCISTSILREFCFPAALSTQCAVKLLGFLPILFRNGVSVEFWSIVFFSCDALVWFLYQGNPGFIEWLGECPLSSIFCKSWWKIGINSSLQVWWNLQAKPSEPGVFFVGNFKINSSISLLFIDLFRYFYFFLSQFQ